MLKLNYLELKDLLSHNVVEVTFKKADDEIRVMECTRNKDYIEKLDGKVGESLLGPKEPIIPVFDVELKEWRSFYADSVVNYNIVVIL